MTVNPKIIKRCWVAASLLAQETEEIEVEPPIADEVNEEVIFWGNWLKIMKKMEMTEGTSNEDYTPPDELMSDNEVIL